MMMLATVMVMMMMINDDGEAFRVLPFLPHIALDDNG